MSRRWSPYHGEPFARSHEGVVALSKPCQIDLDGLGWCRHGYQILTADDVGGRIGRRVQLESQGLASDPPHGSVQPQIFLGQSNGGPRDKSENDERRHHPPTFATPIREGDHPPAMPVLPGPVALYQPWPLHRPRLTRRPTRPGRTRL